MSIIVLRENVYPDLAFVLISQKEGERKYKVDGDIVSIYIEKELVGVNVFHASKYFTVKEGVHSLTKEQINFFVAKNMKFEFSNMLSVGEVVERKTHPNSNKLFVLKVKTDKELQIVTNSLNSTVGKQVVVANVGAILPGLFIEPAKVLGVDSEGMLCGGETLGLKPTKGVLEVKGKNGSEYVL